MAPDVLPTPKGLKVLGHRLTTKRFDPFGVGRGLGGRVAVRGFHPRLMMLFPFGELGSGVIVLPRHNFYVAHPHKRRDLTGGAFGE